MQCLFWKISLFRQNFLIRNFLMGQTHEQGFGPRIATVVSAFSMQTANPSSVNLNDSKIKRAFESFLIEKFGHYESVCGETFVISSSKKAIWSKNAAFKELLDKITSLAIPVTQKMIAEFFRISNFSAADLAAEFDALVKSVASNASYTSHSEPVFSIMHRQIDSIYGGKIFISSIFKNTLLQKILHSFASNDDWIKWTAKANTLMPALNIPGFSGCRSDWIDELSIEAFPPRWLCTFLSAAAQRLVFSEHGIMMFGADAKNELLLVKEQSFPLLVDAFCVNLASVQQPVPLYEHISSVLFGEKHSIDHFPRDFFDFLLSKLKIDAEEIFADAENGSLFFMPHFFMHKMERGIVSSFETNGFLTEENCEYFAGSYDAYALWKRFVGVRHKQRLFAGVEFLKFIYEDCNERVKFLTRNPHSKSRLFAPFVAVRIDAVASLEKALLDHVFAPESSSDWAKGVIASHFLPVFSIEDEYLESVVRNQRDLCWLFAIKNGTFWYKLHVLDTAEDGIDLLQSFGIEESIEEIEDLKRRLLQTEKLLVDLGFVNLVTLIGHSLVNQMRTGLDSASSVKIPSSQPHDAQMRHYLIVKRRMRLEDVMLDARTPLLHLLHASLSHFLMEAFSFKAFIDFSAKFIPAVVDKLNACLADSKALDSLLVSHLTLPVNLIDAFVKAKDFLLQKNIDSGSAAVSQAEQSLRAVVQRHISRKNRRCET